MLPVECENRKKMRPAWLIRGQSYTLSLREQDPDTWASFKYLGEKNPRGDSSGRKSEGAGRPNRRLAEQACSRTECLSKPRRPLLLQRECRSQRSVNFLPLRSRRMNLESESRGSPTQQESSWLAPLCTDSLATESCRKVLSLRLVLFVGQQQFFWTSSLQSSPLARLGSLSECSRVSTVPFSPVEQKKLRKVSPICAHRLRYPELYWKVVSWCLLKLGSRQVRLMTFFSEEKWYCSYSHSRKSKRPVRLRIPPFSFVLVWPSLSISCDADKYTLFFGLQVILI